MDDPQYKTDDGSALRIWSDAIQNNFQTEQHGRPIFDEVIFVEVICPGSTNSIPTFEVERRYCKEAGIGTPSRTSHYERFAKFIEDFKSTEEANKDLTGTPITEWSEVSKSLAASMRAQKIYTVEALAALPDGELSKVGPDGRTWRAKAQAWLEASKDSAAVTRLAAENVLLKDQVAALQADLSALAARVGGEAPATPSEAPEAPSEAPEAPSEPFAGVDLSAPAEQVQPAPKTSRSSPQKSASEPIV